MASTKRRLKQPLSSAGDYSGNVGVMSSPPWVRASGGYDGEMVNASIKSWPQKQGRGSAEGRVSRTHRLSTMVRNCTRDEGGPFEVGSQVQVSSHRKLLSSRAMVVSVAETSGSDPGRQG